MITGKISDVAFRLDLPPHMHLHPVFHVSLLEPYATSSILSRLTTPSRPVEFLDEPEFEVVVVLDSKIVCNKMYYLVDWLGYTLNDRNLLQIFPMLQNSSLHFIANILVNQVLIQTLRPVRRVVEEGG